MKGMTMDDSIKVDGDDLQAARDQLEARGNVTWRRGLMAAVLVLAAAAWGWWLWHDEKLLPEQIGMPSVAAPPPPIPAPPSVPPIANPLAPTTFEEPLPALDASDEAMVAALTGLAADAPWSKLLMSERLIRRIVATVDNLPRSMAPTKTWPVRPAGGWIETQGGGDALALSPKNAARYAAYMNVIKAIDVTRLADLYVRYYPLFQEAYLDLGYPDGYFNDRLVEAIDDLLATPEPKASPRLVQEKVRYQFVDPDLDRRSAGQKILLRVGTDNAQIVKAKLSEFRARIATMPRGE